MDEMTVDWTAEVMDDLWADQRAVKMVDSQGVRTVVDLVDSMAEKKTGQRAELSIVEMVVLLAVLLVSIMEMQLSIELWVEWKASQMVEMQAESKAVPTVS